MLSNPYTNALVFSREKTQHVLNLFKVFAIFTSLLHLCHSNVNLSDKTYVDKEYKQMSQGQSGGFQLVLRGVGLPV